MVSDLFQMDYCLDFNDRQRLVKRVSATNTLPVCSACGSQIANIGLLRKKADEPLDSVKCLPCFLHNYTDLDQNKIDLVVELAEARGWYADEGPKNPIDAATRGMTKAVEELGKKLGQKVVVGK